MVEVKMAEPAEKRWTVAEFLAWDDGTDRRYELVDGRIVAMAPPSEAHGTIVGEPHWRAARMRPAAVSRGRAEAGIIRPDRDDSYYQSPTCSSPAGRLPERASILPTRS